MGKKENSKPKNKITLESLRKDMDNIMGLVENPDVNESAFIHKINAIKKNYSLYMKDEIVEETLSEEKLDKLTQIFIGNKYKDRKIFTPLNEVAEMIANQYLDFADQSTLDEETKKRLQEKASDIHEKVLGTRGTHSEKYPAKYLEEIIRKKAVKSKFPLDNSEILKILNDKINSPILDDEETKLLLENAFIKPILAYKKNRDLGNFRNVRILEVLKSYAQVYRYENDFESYEKYLRLGLDFEQFKGKAQYKEIEDALTRIPELKRKYEDSLNELNQNKSNVLHLDDTDKPDEGLVEIKLNAPANGDGTEEELDKFIEDLSIYPGFSKLFEDDQPISQKQPGPGGVKKHNILTNKEKIRNILLMLKKLKSNPRFKDAQISKCYVKKDIFEKIESESAEEKLKSFDEYIIFPIEGLDKEIFVLECFDPIKEGSLYITNKQCLTPVISMKRAIAKKFRNPKILDFVDHKSTGYVDALTDAVIGIYDEKNTGNRKVRPEQDFTNHLASRMRSTGPSTPPNNGAASNPSKKNSTGKSNPNNISNTPITQSKQIRDIVSSLGSLSLEELKNVLQNLRLETERLEAQNNINEKIIIQRAISIIIVRLQLYAKQRTRSEELQQLQEQIEKEEQDLMSIIPE